MPYRNLAFLLSIVILALASGILVWDGQARNQEFTKSQRLIMDTLLTTVSHEIELSLNNLRRRAQVFSIEYRDAVSGLARNPDDGNAFAVLAEKIDLHLPEHFAFTVTDDSGHTLVEDVEGLVGAVCQNDIIRFSSLDMKPDEEHINEILIHPQPGNYHFDIMSNWFTEAAHGTFFISFRPDVVTDILSQREFPGFELMLIKNDSEGLIEISIEGPRDQLTRAIRLSEAERARIEYSTSIPGSQWTLVVLPAEGLFTDFRRAIRIQIGSVILALLIVSGLMMFLVGRISSRSDTIEAALQDAQRHTRREIEKRDAEIRSLTRQLDEAEAEAEWRKED